jgi:hypothetical protein
MRLPLDGQSWLPPNGVPVWGRWIAFNYTVPQPSDVLVQRELVFWPLSVSELKDGIVPTIFRIHA